jgi:hypothetical protein
VNALSTRWRQMPLRSILASYAERATRPEYPHAVMGVMPEAFHVMRLEKSAQLRHQRDARFYAHALPEGLVASRGLDMEISHAADFAQHVQRAFHPLGGLPDAVSLLFPSSTMRFSLMEVDTLPSSDEERRQTLGWKMSSKLPYPYQETCIAYDVRPAAGPGGKSQVTAVSVKRSLIERLLEIFDSLDVHAGFMTPYALAPVAAMPLEGRLLHAQFLPGLMSLLFTEGGSLRLFRNRAWHTEEGFSERRDDAVQTFRETLTYLQEKLQVPTLDRVLVASHGGEDMPLSGEVLEEAGCPAGPYPWPSGIRAADSSTGAEFSWCPVLAWIAGG